MTTSNMVISIKTDRATYTADLNQGGGDIDEMITAYKGLLVQAGFHPQSVDHCFNPRDGDWFTEDDNSESDLMDELIHSQTS